MFLAVFVELSLSHHCNPNRVSVSLAVSPAYLAQRMRTWRYSCGLFSCVALQLQRFIPLPLRLLLPRPSFRPAPPTSLGHMRTCRLFAPSHPPPPPSSRLLPVSSAHLARRMRAERLFIPPRSPPLLPPASFQSALGTSLSACAHGASSSPPLPLRPSFLRAAPHPPRCKPCCNAGLCGEHRADRVPPGAGGGHWMRGQGHQSTVSERAALRG